MALHLPPFDWPLSTVELALKLNPWLTRSANG